MFEQVEAAFPKAIRADIGEEGIYGRVVLEALDLDVYAPTDADPEWEIRTYFQAARRSAKGKTLEEARDKLFAELRQVLKEFSHKVRKDIAPPFEIAKRPPMPEGFDWVAKGKNRWTTKVGQQQVELRFSARRRTWEYCWNVTGYWRKAGADIRAQLRAQAFLTCNNHRGVSYRAREDADLWQEVAECLNK
jgi:hypothetical protein